MRMMRMMRAMQMGAVLALILTSGAFLTGCTSSSAGPGELLRNQSTISIKAMIDAQGDAWNKGNLNAYMAYFWQSSETKHIFNEQVSTGWEAINERLQAKFADPALMGKISYRDLEINVITKDRAIAAARWRYEVGDFAMDGYFTILVRKIDGRWLIVHDHSSGAPVEG